MLRKINHENNISGTNLGEQLDDTFFCDLDLINVSSVMTRLMRIVVIPFFTTI